MDQVTTLTDLQERLDRLDPRVDEPCCVPGCSHRHRGTLVTHDVVAGQQAA